MEGSFQLKELIAGRRFYGIVRLEVEEIWLYRVEFDIVGTHKDWESPMRLASEYFFAHHKPTEKKRGLRIKILEFHYMDVDTTGMTVFYIFVHALYDAFNRECPLTIDDFGNFVIPR